MKRLPMTPQLIAEIKAAVGNDVDPEGFAVFEVIAVNSLPLPGKNGSIFENAQITPLTLRQMVDNINGGNHLPLIFNHDMSGIPVGRVFKAALSNGETGELEVRALFYVDDTNPEIAAKIDAASLDEVSVQFLASQLLCSECDFDYRGEDATWRHFSDRTCENGHAIGTDGVHLRLVGLQTFTELSLVTRGAANKPKIVGKSQSKLAAPLQALAARGFEINELVCTASKGEYNVDLSALTAQLATLSGEAAVAKAEVVALTAERDTLQTRLTTAEAQIAELQAAEAPEVEQLAAANTEVDAAKAALTEIYTALATAAGETETEIVAPATIAELKDGIDAHRTKLTAMIPIGGVTTKTQKGDAGSKFNASTADAFVVTR